MLKLSIYQKCPFPLKTLENNNLIKKEKIVKMPHPTFYFFSTYGSRFATYFSIELFELYILNLSFFFKNKIKRANCHTCERVARG